MEKIIDPIHKDILISELTKDKFVRSTNAGNNSIYLVNAHNSPNTMLEIGRLREEAFRSAGGGTGKSVDIDDYDTAPIPFQQLIVWNNDAQEIVSAYRFILGSDVPLDENGYPHTPTSKLFHLSKEFIENQWKNCIELGRSFVQPKYQATASAREGLYALDNVWDGLGALTVDYPMRYFFGKMTLYKQYDRTARELILKFLDKHFKGDEKLIYPFKSVQAEEHFDLVKQTFNDPNASIKEDMKVLSHNIRSLNTFIPPLIKTYISLSPSLKCFGIAENETFGEVDEICILIDVEDVYESKKVRHIDSYRLKVNNI